jgi:hypothetical protein
VALVDGVVAAASRFTFLLCQGPCMDLLRALGPWLARCEGCYQQESVGSRFRRGCAYRYLHYVLRHTLRLHWVQNTTGTGASVAREAHGPKATQGDGDEGSRAMGTRGAGRWQWQWRRGEQGDGNSDGDEGSRATATVMATRGAGRRQRRWRQGAQGNGDEGHEVMGMRCTGRGDEAHEATATRGTGKQQQRHGGAWGNGSDETYEAMVETRHGRRPQRQRDAQDDAGGQCRSALVSSCR